jgi:hypothetical protein
MPQLLRKLKDLTVALLHEGFFTRGAICKGLLHQDDQMVFGEALINAHALEATVVKYPRIMITKDVVEDAFNSDMSNDDLAHFKKAKDGPHYLHVLWKIGVILESYRDILCTRTTDVSIICTAASWPEANAFISRSQTPACRQRTKRL